MTRFLGKIIMATFGIALLASSALPSAFAAQYVSVSLPTFNITMNDVRIDNNERQYPIIVYKDITYVPMTYNDSRFLGLETKWSAETGLQVNKISEQQSYNPNRGSFNSNLESAVLPDFRISVNGKNIDNNSESFPLLVFRDITYFPLTWRFMVNEFGWTSKFDMSNGLVISSKASGTGSATPTPPPVSNQVYSREFGNVGVILDRYSNRQPGNLFIRMNNSTRKIGNPNYIYGVNYSRRGGLDAYDPVDELSLTGRWIYTIAIDPYASPITSRRVRINIDTGDVEFVDAGPINDSGSPSDQVYSLRFGNITVILDRFSNRQPGNLYVRVNNRTKKIGNPNYIYGVSYLRRGRVETYEPVDQLNVTDRWVYTVAVDPFATPIVNKNVRVNIDTDEVQTLADGAGNDNYNPSNQVFSRQFGDVTLILDRFSNRQPGNLYRMINNRTQRIGNPNYIYGVSYSRRSGAEAYTPVDELSLTGRWAYTVAIDPSVSPLRARNVRVNINTNEVQYVDGITR